MQHILDKAKNKLKNEFGDHGNHGSAQGGGGGGGGWPQRMSDDPRSMSQQAIEVFLLSKQGNGEVSGIGYWQTANGYTAITLYDLWSNTSTNRAALEDAVGRVVRNHPGLINEFNDDTLWWGNCCFNLYQLTNNDRYLEIASTIWNHVSHSVVPAGRHNVHNMDMGGGVFWKSRAEAVVLNAITTGLFAELSASLATVQSRHLPPRDRLVDAARNSMDWIVRCRYRDNEAIVTDTIKIDTGELVDWTFTYNTGQAIAGATALYNATNDAKYINLATKLAKASMTRRMWVEEDGVLTEAGSYGPKGQKAGENNDAVGFKSVLMRSIAKLYLVLRTHQLESELQRQIEAFVRTNYQSLVQKNTNGNGQFGPWWNGPMDQPTSHSQMAVLDVFAAMSLVEKTSGSQGGYKTEM